MANYFNCPKDTTSSSVRPNTGCKWIEARDNDLKRMWGDGNHIDYISKCLGRSYLSICMRLEHLGFLKRTSVYGRYELLQQPKEPKVNVKPTLITMPVDTIPTGQRARNGHIWSKAADGELIHSWHAHCTITEMANTLGRTHSSIMGRLCVLNILKYCQGTKYEVLVPPGYPRDTAAKDFGDYQRLIESMPDYPEQIPIVVSGESHVTWAQAIVDDFHMNDFIGVPQPMSTEAPKTIETKIYINGNLASGMSDEAIYQAIANVEAEIKRLSDIKNRPKRLQEKLDEMAADIAKLVEYVDGR